MELRKGILVILQSSVFQFGGKLTGGISTRLSVTNARSGKLVSENVMSTQNAYLNGNMMVDLGYRIFSDLAQIEYCKRMMRI